MIATQHIHPMIVHFPIVLFMSLAGLDIVALLSGERITGRSGWGVASTALALLSGLSAAVAWVFGSIALGIAEAGGFHSQIAEIHEGLGGATAAVFAAWALIRLFAWWRDMDGGRVLAGIVALVEIAGSLLVIVTAYYGGLLVYGLGVNVARAAGG